MEHIPSEVSLNRFDDLVPIADILNSSGSQREEIPTFHHDDN